jgi:hypothetical protein
LHKRKLKVKIYLIKTPEYNIEDFNEVCSFLKDFEGPLEFIPSTYKFDKSDFYFLRYELFPYHSFKYSSNESKILYDTNRATPLSWRELFSLCNYYREVFRIEDDSFVVLLTNRKNALNWFSAPDKLKNIFVHTAEWDSFTKVSPKYPIAYQIIENILQVLMKADLENVPNNYIHNPIRGCMNDFCENKKQIIVKLQTANICEDCLAKISEEDIKLEILEQALTIFNGIRNEVVFQGIKKVIKPSPIIVDNKFKILIPEHNLEIKLTPLFKTLYLFFLQKDHGIAVSELSNYCEELEKIYKKIRPGLSKQEASNKIESLTFPTGDGFNPTKSHINKTITKLLGKELADFYKISGQKGKPYFIKIPKNIIDIRF